MFLARAVGLILLPIYTRQLGSSDFGFIEIIAAISAFLLIILPLDINQAVGRLLPESKSTHQIKGIISTSLLFTAFVFAVFGFLVYICRFWLLDFVGVSHSYAKYTYLITLYFFIQAIVNLLQVQFRFTQQAKSSVAVNMAVVLTNLVLVLYFSSRNNLGVEQYFLSQFLGGFVGCFVGFYSIAKRHGLISCLNKFNISLLKEFLKYSLPLVISSIGVALAGNVDRLMVGTYLGLKELGYYGVAFRLSSIVAIGFYVLSTALTPIVYRDFNTPQTKVLIAKVFEFTLCCCALLLFVIAVYSNEIVSLIAGAEFSQASMYIFYLTLASVISNSYIFFLGMDITKNTKVISAINIGSGLVGAIGTASLLPILGVWGAVISTVLASIIRLFGYIYNSQREYYLQLSFKRLTFLLLILFFVFWVL